MWQNAIVRTVNIVVTGIFFWTNCVWAGVGSFKLAAPFHVTSLAPVADVFVTGQGVGKELFVDLVYPRSEDIRKSEMRDGISISDVVSLDDVDQSQKRQKALLQRLLDLLGLLWSSFYSSFSGHITVANPNNRIAEITIENFTYKDDFINTSPAKPAAIKICTIFIKVLEIIALRPLLKKTINFLLFDLHKL